MNARLFSIELRRNVALPLLPVMALISLLLVVGDRFTTRALFYVETNLAMVDLMLFTVPLLAGAAALVGGRERRRGMEDLLATTPWSSWCRHLLAWAATLICGVLAYLAVAGFVVILTSRYAHWSAPVVWSLLFVLLVLSSAAALGYTLGHTLPGRFTAPLVALGSLLALFAGWVAVTSPVSYADRAAWLGRPTVEIFPALVALALTGVALGSLALPARRGRDALPVVGVAGLLLIVGLNGGLHRDAHPIPGPLTCSRDALPVCVQRAYQPWLNSDAAVINQIAAPLLGVPGAPTRAEQQPAVQRGVTEDVLIFHPQDEAIGNAFPGVIAISLIRNSMPIGRYRPTCPSDPTGAACSSAQDAIALWLVQRTGHWTAFSGINGHWLGLSPIEYWDATSAAAQRFAALEPARQRAWLSSHYVGIRQGTVRLEELP